MYRGFQAYHLCTLSHQIGSKGAKTQSNNGNYSGQLRILNLISKYITSHLHYGIVPKLIDILVCHTLYSIQSRPVQGHSGECLGYTTLHALDVD